MAATRQYLIPGGGTVGEESSDIVNAYVIPGIGTIAETVEAAAGGTVPHSPFGHPLMGPFGGPL